MKFLAYTMRKDGFENKTPMEARSTQNIPIQSSVSAMIQNNKADRHCEINTENYERAKLK